MTNFGEFNMNPIDAVRAPRFGLGSPATFNKTIFEGHFPEDIFAALEARGVDYLRVSPSRSTGLVGAMHIASNGVTSVAQDPRRDGLALT